MILGYRDRRAERFASGQFVTDLQGIEHQATKTALDPECSSVARNLEDLAEQSAGSSRGRSEGTVFDPHQPSMADLFRMAGGTIRAELRRDRGLPFMKEGCTC